MNCYVLPGRLVLHYTMLHILASTSLLLKRAVGYQSLSSLYSKRSLWNLFLANSLTISECVFRLHSRNVLVILDIWNGARSCLKIYIPSVGTQRIHISLCFTVIAINTIVVFGANGMRNIMISVFRLLQNRQ